MKKKIMLVNTDDQTLDRYGNLAGHQFSFLPQMIRLFINRGWEVCVFDISNTLRKEKLNIPGLNQIIIEDGYKNIPKTADSYGIKKVMFLNNDHIRGYLEYSSKMNSHLEHYYMMHDINYREYDNIQVYNERSGILGVMEPGKKWGEYFDVICKYCKKVFVETPSMKKYVLKFSNADEHKITYIPYGYYTDNELTTNKEKVELEYDLAHVGVLRSSKPGLIWFLELLSEINLSKEVRILIAGDPIDERYLSLLKESLNKLEGNDNIKVTRVFRSLSQNEFNEFILKSRYILVPYHRTYPSHFGPLLEGPRFDTPLMVTGIHPAIDEIYEIDKIGFTYPPNIYRICGFGKSGFKRLMWFCGKYLCSKYDYKNFSIRVGTTWGCKKHRDKVKSIVKDIIDNKLHDESIFQEKIQNIRKYKLKFTEKKVGERFEEELGA